MYSDAYGEMVLALKTARHEKKLDQEHLGRIIGKDQKFISRIESFNQIINIEELFEYCRALEIDFSELVSKYAENNHTVH